MDESTSLALMIAAVCEAILARPYARTLWANLQGNRAFNFQSAGRRAAPSLFRQSLALSALAGAYLGYYFLEVNLQIASLNSLTVFLPLTSVT